MEERDLSYQYLKDLIFDGAKAKGLALTDEVLDRINYEMCIIRENDFVEYLIIYSKIIEICNDFGILRSPGRGGAAGSLINYCLDITKVDPIANGLLFERFIYWQDTNNPEIDIDIDIPVGYCDIVLEEFKRRYSEYNVYYFAFIPKTIEDGLNIVHKGVIYKKHPCAIIITKQTLTHSIFYYEKQPYYYADNISDFPLKDFRFDILELGYLNRLQTIVDIIGDEYHPYELPLDDKKVFEFLESGDLHNIFLFNSVGIPELLQNFNPDSLGDLALVNAICRPGLINQLPELLACKKGEHAIDFNTRRLSEILKETYGVLIYSETLLQILHEIVGMSYVEAMDCWNYIKKGNTKNNLQFTEFFLKKCSENSTLNDNDVKELLRLIQENGQHCFLKAHSLCYSTIGYWGAYYKTHFEWVFNKAFRNETPYTNFNLAIIEREDAPLPRKMNFKEMESDFNILKNLYPNCGKSYWECNSIPEKEKLTLIGKLKYDDNHHKYNSYEKFINWASFKNYCTKENAELRKILSENNTLEQTEIKNWVTKNEYVCFEELYGLWVENQGSLHTDDYFYLQATGEYLEKKEFKSILEFCEVMNILYFGEYHLPFEERTEPDPNDYYYVKPNPDDPSDLEQVKSILKI